MNREIFSIKSKRIDMRSSNSEFRNFLTATFGKGIPKWLSCKTGVHQRHIFELKIVNLFLRELSVSHLPPG